MLDPLARVDNSPNMAWTNVPGVRSVGNAPRAQASRRVSTVDSKSHAQRAPTPARVIACPTTTRSVDLARALAPTRRFSPSRAAWCVVAARTSSGAQGLVVVAPAIIVAPSILDMVIVDLLKSSQWMFAIDREPEP